MVGTAQERLCPPYKSPLLRRDLSWRGRRVGEVGDQLRVARLGVRRGLFLDRTVTADTIRQRQQLDRGFQRDQRKRSQHGGDIVFVRNDQLALELAVGAV